MQVNIKNLIDDAQCYDTVRKLRWPEGMQAHFVIPDVLSEEGLMKRNQPDNAMVQGL